MPFLLVALAWTQGRSSLDLKLRHPEDQLLTLVCEEKHQAGPGSPGRYFELLFGLRYVLIDLQDEGKLRKETTKTGYYFQAPNLQATPFCVFLRDRPKLGQAQACNTTLNIHHWSYQRSKCHNQIYFSSNHKKMQLMVHKNTTQISATLQGVWLSQKSKMLLALRDLR